MIPVAIVGGGISGLTAAYYLSRHGIPSRLYEPRPTLGGLIATERVGGCLAEAGPDSWLAEKSWMRDLIEELGLTGQIIDSQDEQRQTWIVRDGRLHRLPDSMRLLAPTKPWQIAGTRLFGTRTKLRFAAEWFRRPARRDDRSVAAFVGDHFGDEAVEYLAQPMLSGVYGSPPESLSANAVIPQFVYYERQYGSILRGAYRQRHRKQRKPLFESLRGGLGDLVDALARAIAVRCAVVHERVQSVERTSGGWRVLAGGTWTDAAEVVVATPASKAAQLVAEAVPDLSAALGSIRYEPSVVLALTFPAEGFGRTLDGFGLLVPRAEKANVAACTWVNTKFAGRAAPGTVLLRAFLGGEAAHRAMETDDQRVVEVVDRELRGWMGYRPAPITGRIWRWRTAMPQYRPGHAVTLESIASSLDTTPGLHLAGNGYDGLGIPDCVRRSKGIAGRIAAARTEGTRTPTAGSP